MIFILYQIWNYITQCYSLSFLQAFYDPNTCGRSGGGVWGWCVRTGYSCRRFSTGFVMETLKAYSPTIKNPRHKVPAPASKNISNPIGVRYTNWFSQSRTTKYAGIKDNTMAMKISTINSRDTKITRLPGLAPNTFRILTSFILCWPNNDDSPNKPIPAIIIARIVKNNDKLPALNSRS